MSQNKPTPLSGRMSASDWASLAACDDPARSASPATGDGTAIASSMPPPSSASAGDCPVASADREAASAASRECAVPVFLPESAGLPGLERISANHLPWPESVPAAAPLFGAIADGPLLKPGVAVVSSRLMNPPSTEFHAVASAKAAVVAGGMAMPLEADQGFSSVAKAVGSPLRFASEVAEVSGL